MAEERSKNLLAVRLKGNSFNPHRRGSEPIGRPVCTCDQLCQEHRRQAKYPQLLDLNHPYYPFPLNAPDSSNCQHCKLSVSGNDEVRRRSVSDNQISFGKCLSCHMRIRRDTCPETRSALSSYKAAEHAKNRRSKRPSGNASEVRKENNTESLPENTVSNSREEHISAATPTVLEEETDEKLNQVASLRSLLSEMASMTVAVEKELMLATESNCNKLHARIKSMDVVKNEELLAERDGLVQLVSMEHGEIVSRIEQQLKRLREKVKNMDKYCCSVEERDLTVVGQTKAPGDCHATAAAILPTILVQSVDDFAMNTEGSSKRRADSANSLSVESDIYSFCESDGDVKSSEIPSIPKFRSMT